MQSIGLHPRDSFHSSPSKTKNKKIFNSQSKTCSTCRGSSPNATRTRAPVPCYHKLAESSGRLRIRASLAHTPKRKNIWTTCFSAIPNRHAKPLNIPPRARRRSTGLPEMISGKLQAKTECSSSFQKCFKNLPISNQKKQVCPNTRTKRKLQLTTCFWTARQKQKTRKRPLSNQKVTWEGADLYSAKCLILKMLGI